MKNSLFKYFFTSRTMLWQIIAGFIIVVIAVIFIITRLPVWVERGWGIVEPVLGFGTLVIALFIWYNEKKQEWEFSLPKKLNVTYELNDDPFAGIINAPLTSEQDIRNWGLSIAQTVLNVSPNRIKFSGFKLAEPKKVRLQNGQMAMLYGITFYLKESINREEKDAHGETNTIDLEENLRFQKYNDGGKIENQNLSKELFTKLKNDSCTF